MPTTVARTKQDVDKMSMADRLWDSMGYTYGARREAIQQEFDKAYSQADNQAISRGMGRSSYNNQTLANINKQRADAIANNWSEQIADYENRLYQIQRDEKADEQWQAQFNEGVRQFDTNLAYQQERAAAGDNQWQLQFNYGKERDTVGDQQWQAQFDYGKERDTVADQQWQKQFDEGVRQFNDEMAYKYYAKDGSGSKSGGSSSPGSNPGTKKTGDDTGKDTGRTSWQDFVKGLGIEKDKVTKTQTALDPKSGMGDTGAASRKKNSTKLTRTISNK